MTESRNPERFLTPALVACPVASAHGAELTIDRLDLWEYIHEPFEIMVYPGAKHGLVRQHDGRHGFTTMKRFFDDNLLR
jgi:hypothetical protein